VQSNLVESKNPSERDSSNNGQSELPFTLQELKSAIPTYCFEPSPWKSLSYFFLDISIIGLLYGVAAFFDSWWFWPVFWLMQGTMFWALFVVGHDCGHGSFSKHKWLNNLIGIWLTRPFLSPSRLAHQPQNSPSKHREHRHR
jgi:omega-3 fatty acid desaturase (delta-15 desaturase)